MLKGYVKVNIKMECLEDMLELVLGWYWILMCIGWGSKRI